MNIAINRSITEVAMIKSQRVTLLLEKAIDRSKLGEIFRCSNPGPFKGVLFS